MEDLQRIYELLRYVVSETKNRLDCIDKILENCDRLSAEYWRDARVEKGAFLKEIHK